MIIQMRGDKCTHSMGPLVKIPLLLNKVGKRSGQQGHDNREEAYPLNEHTFLCDVMSQSELTTV